MKKIYCVGIIIVLAAALGISKLYFSLRSDDIQETVPINKAAEAEKKIPASVNKADGVTIAPISEEKSLNVMHPKTKPMIMPEKKSDYVNDLKLALLENNESDAQIALESAAACESCIAQLKEIISDTSYDKTFRKYSAKALIKSGNPGGILTVLKAIIDAHTQEDYGFKDNLLQIFADVKSVESANALLDILTRKNTDFPNIPDDIKYAIKKAVRLTDDEIVGQNIKGRYHEAEQESKTELLSIDHAIANAQLAAEAYSKGNKQEADVFLERLGNAEDKAAFQGIMSLAKEKSFSTDNLSEIMALWALTTPNHDEQLFNMTIEYLSNQNFTAEQRAVAASALPFIDADLGLKALEKAYKYEQEPTVKKSIETALVKIKNKKAD